MIEISMENEKIENAIENEKMRPQRYFQNTKSWYLICTNNNKLDMPKE